MAINKLIGSLFDGPLDIVGDVHGEIEPLRQLLGQLGYNQEGGHPEHRRLVFVGDLGDRGPDSPAVGELVMSLVERDLAQCILGNHELNLLRGDHKDGDAWFRDPNRKEQLEGGEFAHSRVAPEDFKGRYREFLASLPLALERSDLRIVHAAWMPREIETLRFAHGSAIEVYREYEILTNKLIHMEGLKERADREKVTWGHLLEDRNSKVPLLTALGECDERYQMGNPVRAITSGVERLASAPFWSSGKWRMCDRVKWWNEYEADIPVIIGHYWRRRWPVDGSAHAGSKRDLFGNAGPTDWMGAKRNVFCVDYSIGARYEERKAGKTQFDTCLAAMRWPERELWFETGRAA
jgi:hypothetical protein